MPYAVSHRRNRFWSQVSPCEFCYRQSGTWKDLSPITSVCSVRTIPPAHYTYSFICHRRCVIIIFDIIKKDCICRMLQCSDNRERVVYFPTVGRHFPLLQSMQTGSRAHLASCSKVNRGSFPWAKRAEAWAILLITCMPLWLVQRQVSYLWLYHLERKCTVIYKKLN
jgi:hypothetical protein